MMTEKRKESTVGGIKTNLTKIIYEKRKQENGMDLV